MSIRSDFAHSDGSAMTTPRVGDTVADKGGYQGVVEEWREDCVVVRWHSGRGATVEDPADLKITAWATTSPWKLN